MQSKESLNTEPENKSRGTFPEVSDNSSLGVLLLHGFTSSLDCVNGLVPSLESLNIPYEMPVLRGHGQKPEALVGVKAADWYADGLAAFEKLSDRVDRILVIGLSMGGLVALNLCVQDHPGREKICGCVTWAAALGFCNPLAFLAKPLSKFIKMFPGQDSFRDDECRKKCTNYPKFPTCAFVELYDYAKQTNLILNKVKVPLCIIHSKRDQVVPYKTSEHLYGQVSSDYVEHHALLRSGHELGQDCECETVFKLTCDFIERFRR